MILFIQQMLEILDQLFVDNKVMELKVLFHYQMIISQIYRMKEEELNKMEEELNLILILMVLV